MYLFRKAGGSSYTAASSAVQMTRADDADRWLDRGSFVAGSPEALGTSNTGYGPNLTGTVCEGDTPRASTDRFPRDAMTVTPLKSTPTPDVGMAGARAAAGERPPRTSSR